jgi:hypothetical protein
MKNLKTFEDFVNEAKSSTHTWPDGYKYNGKEVDKIQLRAIAEKLFSKLPKSVVTEITLKDGTSVELAYTYHPDLEGMLELNYVTGDDKIFQMGMGDTFELRDKKKLDKWQEVIFRASYQ